MDLIFYCDESCHIQTDGVEYMSLVSAFCSKSRIKNINKDIRRIKEKYGISPNQELKWTKISKTNLEMYKEIIRYVSEKTYIRIRGVLAKKRTPEQLLARNKTYDQWYHSIYYYLLKHPLELISDSNVEFDKCFLFIDKKDIYTTENIVLLAEFLKRHLCYRYDFLPIAVDSKEHQLVQVADIVAGALTYRKRFVDKISPKNEMCDFIEQSFGSLKNTSPYKNIDFNLLVIEKEEL